MSSGRFKLGQAPWNKGLKRAQTAWNKGLIGYGAGRKLSAETRKRIADAHRGQIQPEDQVKAAHDKWVAATLKRGAFGRVSSKWMKKKLVSDFAFEPICSQCQLSEWQGQRLTLALDHINGVHDDNTLSNLRLLCPNCHSLTTTHSHRNVSMKSCGKRHPACLICKPDFLKNRQNGRRR